MPTMPQPETVGTANPERHPLDVIAATLVSAGLAGRAAHRVAQEIIYQLFLIDALSMNPSQRAMHDRNMAWAVASMLWDAQQLEDVC